MSRGTIVRLADHQVRLWRPVTSASSRIGMDRRTLELVADGEPCKVNRDTSPTADAGPGLSPIGRRRLYLPPELDVRERDVVELVTGPDAPQTWEVDELPARPRGHHLQADCILWRGTLPEVAS